MTYNLEEFKNWLNQNPENKAGLNSWDAMNDCLEYNGFEYYLNNPDKIQPPYLLVIKKWVAERERERERERAKHRNQYDKKPPSRT